MGDPIKTDGPNLQTVMCELVSAQSSLNMPVPSEASRKDVQHAYEHLQEATRQLAIMANKENEEYPFKDRIIGVDTSTLSIDIAGVMRDMGFNIPDGSMPKFCVDTLNSRLRTGLNPFEWEPNTQAVRQAIRSTCIAIISQMEQEGFFTKNGNFRCPDYMRGLYKEEIHGY